ncbi:MAG: hypothetical protein H7X97_10495 [Opitutaceae bacterium]|nr:hypothetical protein [Verrucomicrobiales bacterium]
MAGLTEAVHAALDGPGREDIEISQHRFDVKRAQRLDFNADTHVWGQISHKPRTRPYEHVYFHIIKKGGILTSMERHANPSGWEGVHGRVAVVLAGLHGVPIPPEAVSVATDQLGQIVPDGWEQACDLMITAIALRV